MRPYMKRRNLTLAALLLGISLLGPRAALPENVPAAPATSVMPLCAVTIRIGIERAGGGLILEGIVSMDGGERVGERVDAEGVWKTARKGFAVARVLRRTVACLLRHGLQALSPSRGT